MRTVISHARRWTFEEYARLGELGFFRRRRVELVGGRIIELAPQRDVHAAVLSLVFGSLTRCYGNGYWVRPQLPLQLGKWSGPEPDISVVTGGPRDYIGTGHPQSAILVVEISDTSLRFDRRSKAGLYAKYGIQDYWIINLVDRRLEVYRDPVSDFTHPFRHRFNSITQFAAAQIVRPPGTNSDIAVSDLLP